MREPVNFLGLALSSRNFKNLFVHLEFFQALSCRVSFFLFCKLKE